jgi:hypothetical protein
MDSKKTGFLLFISAGFIVILYVLTSLGVFNRSGDLDCSLVDNSKVLDNTNWTKRDYCYYSEAQMRDNVSLCEKMMIGRETCYTDFARLVGDPSVCSGIDNIERRDWCYSGIASLKHDPSICDKISPNNINKDSCYYSIAMAEKNTEICADMSDPDYTHQCEAEISLDNTSCEKIIDYETKGICYKRVYYDTVSATRN